VKAEGGGEAAVDAHAGCATLVQQLSPPDVSHLIEAHCAHARFQEPPIHCIICSSEICEQQPARMVLFAQVVRQAEVIEHVVSNLPAMDEGGLRGINHRVQGRLQTIGNRLCQDLDIAVEQRDGPV